MRIKTSLGSLSVLAAMVGFGGVPVAQAAPKGVNIIPYKGPKSGPVIPNEHDMTRAADLLKEERRLFGLGENLREPKSERLKLIFFRMGDDGECRLKGPALINLTWRLGPKND